MSTATLPSSTVPLPKPTRGLSRSPSDPTSLHGRPPSPRRSHSTYSSHTTAQSPSGDASQPGNNGQHQSHSLSHSLYHNPGHGHATSKIYVLSADGSRLFLLDPSKPPPHEEPPPYAAISSPGLTNHHLSPSSGEESLVREGSGSGNGLSPISSPGSPGPAVAQPTGLGLRTGPGGGSGSGLNLGPSSPGLPFPTLGGSGTLLLPPQHPEAGPSRHRASTMSAIAHRSLSPEYVPRRPRGRGHSSYEHSLTLREHGERQERDGRNGTRSAMSSPGLPTGHLGGGAGEETPLLGMAAERRKRGLWRAIWCGELDEGDERTSWSAGWVRFWNPVGRSVYWIGLVHLWLLNFPFALLVWPPLVAGTLAGTALLITLPIGAAVWWLTLFISRSAARLETIMQLHYHSTLDPSIPPPTYHPIFHRLKAPSAPTSPISPISEHAPELVWETRFIKCSTAMFTDHYSYSALSYFLLIKPVVTLFSTILVLALFPLALGTIFGLPVYLRAARRWGRWQAGVALENLDHTSFTTQHRAEHLSRHAAAAAHASYYAHPSLHLHSYLKSDGANGVHANGDGVVDGDKEGAVVKGMNEAYTKPQLDGAVSTDGPKPTPIHVPPSAGPEAVPNGAQTGQDQVGTDGTVEEEGGKTTAGKPSGMDKGALEMNGEAGGTITSPGPTVQEVKAFQERLVMNGEAGVGAQPGAQPKVQDGQPETLAVPRAQQVGRPVPEGRGAEFWSVSERMDPHLQLMCGPLLSYYTVQEGLWQGAAMVVAADAGSDYTRNPSISFTFQPYLAHSTPSTNATPAATGTPVEPVGSVGLGPTNGIAAPTLLQPQIIQGQKIHTYESTKGSSSFWRFMLEVPLQEVEMAVRYRLNGGAEMEFVIPKRGENFRWAAHSCNGFSSGVNPDEFKGSYPSGYDPVWEDLLAHHHEKPYHCMVGGGDQIYCDAVTREPELQSWINAPNRKEKLGHPLTDEMRVAIDRFYFNHYCKIFRSNAFGRANSSIPMVNMLDDHDLIDGFGTYDDETQSAPVMSFIGSRGYFWFLLFQLFVCDTVDGTNPTVGTHVLKSMIIGEPGAWIPFPSHSLLVYLGPKVEMLALDCRAERKLGRIVSKETYAKVFGEVRKLKGRGVEQLVILLGVPIAYPRMSFLEHFLDFKYNPVNILARHNALGLGGMVNKFNQASELLDDLNDHWCANVHKKERNWLVLECQKLALEMNFRITFLSGDVHLAAVGCLFTKHRGDHKPREPEKDYRYMLNVITSAIVNTPPPAGAATMVAFLGKNKHRTLHKDQTDECMIPHFSEDTDGSPLKRKIVLARRNYASVDYLDNGELLFDFRIEKSQGAGETKSYPLKVPPPRWA